MRCSPNESGSAWEFRPQPPMFDDNDAMQNNHNKKESFKLLQLSDDSKSLTELELPQVNQTIHIMEKNYVFVSFAEICINIVTSCVFQ